MSGGSPAAGSGGTTAIEATATGTVQGVGFRYHTRQRAEALGLCGSAVNQQDGSVLVTAQGPEEAVTALLEWLRSPRAPGRVAGLEVRRVDPVPGATRFEIG